jgi:hypothetical protein
MGRIRRGKLTYKPGEAGAGIQFARQQEAVGDFSGQF